MRELIDVEMEGKFYCLVSEGRKACSISRGTTSIDREAEMGRKSYER